jgi:hypothetical protein
VAAAIKVMVMVERKVFIVIGVSVLVCRSIETEEGYVRWRGYLVSLLV